MSSGYESSNGYYNYRLLGLDPGKPEGVKFQSRVPELDLKYNLWPTECPYRFPDGLRLDIVKEGEQPDPLPAPPRGFEL